MEELKNKFVEAMKSIDFGTLTIYELHEVAEIADKVDKMARKDYTDMLAETMRKGFGNSSNYEKPKTIGEMTGGK